VRLAEDEYVEWSTVVDAPVTYICDRAEAVQEWGEQRVTRADFHVSSAWPAEFQAATPGDFIAGNRAGPDETELSLAELRDQYREPSS